MKYNFEWDPNKAKTNKDKHGVSFEDACTVFKDPKALTLFDEQHSEYEERWITLGLAFSGRLLVVCHTFKEINKEDSIIRIFSSRKATKREADEYGEKNDEERI